MKEMTIAQLRSSAEALKKATDALGEKATWSPLDKGRSAVDQVAECALISQFTAGILESGVMPEVDWEAFGRAKAALDTPEKALAALLQGTDAVIAQVGALGDDRAGNEVTLPWGEVVTLGGLPRIVIWNNTYHEGQINYISTLA